MSKAKKNIGKGGKSMSSANNKLSEDMVKYYLNIG